RLERVPGGAVAGAAFGDGAADLAGHLIVSRENLGVADEVHVERRATVASEALDELDQGAAPPAHGVGGVQKNRPAGGAAPGAICAANARNAMIAEVGAEADSELQRGAARDAEQEQGVVSLDPGAAGLRVMLGAEAEAD